MVDYNTNDWVSENEYNAQDWASEEQYNDSDWASESEVTSQTKEPEKPESAPTTMAGEAWQTVRNIGKVYPAAETAASFASTAYGLPLSGIYGLLHAPWGMDKMKEAVDEAQQFLIYQPQTEGGQELTEATAYPFEKWHEFAQYVGQEVEKTDHPAVAATMATIVESAPFVFPMLHAKMKAGEVGKAKKAMSEKQMKKNMERALTDYMDELRKVDEQKVLETEYAKRELDKNVESVKSLKQELDAASKRVEENKGQLYDLETAEMYVDDLALVNELPNKIKQLEQQVELAKKGETTPKRKQFMDINEKVAEINEIKAQAESKYGTVSTLVEQAKAGDPVAQRMSSSLYNNLKNIIPDKAFDPIMKKSKLQKQYNERMIELQEMNRKLAEMQDDGFTPNLRQMAVEAENSKPFEFMNKTTEELFNAARTSDKSNLQRLWGSVKETATDWWHKISREYEHLPKTRKFAPLRNDLLRMSKQRSMSQDKAARIIYDMVGELTPEQYDLFNRKVVLEDIYSELKNQSFETVGPYEFTIGDAYKELQRVNKKAETAGLQQALVKRQKFWEALRQDYTDAMSQIGIDVSQRLSKENYFRRMIVDYLETKNVLEGEGRKLKSPSRRGYLKKRKKGTDDFVSDYMEAEGNVLSNMFYDMELAKVIKSVRENYDIKSAIQRDMIKDIQKGKFLDKKISSTEVATPEMLQAWKEYFAQNPDKYKNFVIWKPKEGHAFHVTDNLPARILSELMRSQLEHLGMTEGKMRAKIADKFKNASGFEDYMWFETGKKKQVAIPMETLRNIEFTGESYEPLVIPREVATTIENLYMKKSDNPVLSGHRKLLKGWKIYTLTQPKRAFKYNFRNLTGDAEATFVGNHMAFRKVPQALDDIILAYRTKGPLENVRNAKGEPVLKNYMEWMERGGEQGTLTAQEIGTLNKLQEQINKLSQKERGAVDTTIEGGKKAWNKYWGTAKKLTDTREIILRYANYLEYLDQIKKDPQGKPKNFGASIPEEIMGLKNPQDRAYWLANDLLGAYDRVGVAGQALRENLYPFWSWKEVNTRRYWRLMANAFKDKRIMEVVGRQMAGKGLNPYWYVRVGLFTAKAAAFWKLLKWYNETAHPELEKNLPEDIQRSPHIILGEDDKGNIQYFNRIGTAQDMLETLGLDVPILYWDEYINKGKGIKEVAKEMSLDMLKSASNSFVQGSEPFAKLAGELITRRKLFPDIWRPGTVRDRVEHLFQFAGWKDEFKRLSGRPHKQEGMIENYFIYEADPDEAAYYDTLKEKAVFLKDRGKASEGFFLTKQGSFLYNARLALKFGQHDLSRHYMLKYLENGGKVSNLRKSLERMDPLSGLTKEERIEFFNSLDGEKKERLRKAYKYYLDLTSYHEETGPEPEAEK